VVCRPRFAYNAPQLDLNKGSMKKLQTIQQHNELARQLLADHGERQTRTRVAVLSILLAASNALSHQDIAEKLEKMGEGCDRVTLYRVLDRLVEQGLAHKLSGDDRVWRFNAAVEGQHQHPHFHCVSCGKVTCLDTVSINVGRLPAGYTSQSISTTIEGSCPQCR